VKEEDIPLSLGRLGRGDERLKNRLLRGGFVNLTEPETRFRIRLGFPWEEGGPRMKL